MFYTRNEAKRRCKLQPCWFLLSTHGHSWSLRRRDLCQPPDAPRTRWAPRSQAMWDARGRWRWRAGPRQQPARELKIIEDETCSKKVTQNCISPSTAIWAEQRRQRTINIKSRRMALGTDVMFVIISKGQEDLCLYLKQKSEWITDYEETLRFAWYHFLVN